jgi:mannosyltransferase
MTHLRAPQGVLDHRRIVLILLVAAALRFAGLGTESLWLDESATVKRVQTDYWTVVTRLNEDTQLPLYYLMEKAWCAVFGTSEFALRAPSAFFGTAAVGGTYLLGCELFSPAAGLAAALLTAVNPFAVFYSQEARPYILFFLSAVLSFYFAARLLRRLTAGGAVGYVLFSTAAIYSHNFGPLVLIVHVAGYLISRHQPDREATRWRLLPFLLLGAAPVILSLPLAAFVFRQASLKMAGVSPASWIPVPTLFSVAHTFRQYFMQPVGAVVVGVAAILTAVSGLTQNIPLRRGVLWALAIMVTFVAVPFAVSRLLTPVYVPRYTIPALAGVLLLAGAGVVSLRRPWLVVPSLILLTAVSALPMLDYYTKVDKDPWREAGAVLQQRTVVGDAIVLSPPYVDHALSRYFQPLAGVVVSRSRDLNEMARLARAAGRVWLVEALPYRSSVSPEMIRAAAAANRAPVDSVDVADGLRLNPYAYHVARIRITLFQ